jgi:hypothetical protein
MIVINESNSYDYGNVIMIRILATPIRKWHPPLEIRRTGTAAAST